MQEKHCPIYVERISDRDTAAAAILQVTFKKNKYKMISTRILLKASRVLFSAFGGKIHKIWLQKFF